MSNIKLSVNHPTKTPEEHQLNAHKGWVFMEVQNIEAPFFTNFNYSFINWEGGTRNGTNFISACGVIIDYDDGSITAEEVKQWLDFNNVNYIIVNSKSHKPEHHKIHVLLPFSKEITNKDTYKAYVFTAMEMLPGTPDGCVHDVGRFMGYTPPEKLQIYYDKFDGIYFDKFTAPTADSKKAMVKKHKLSVDTVSNEFRKNDPLKGKWIATDELIPLIADKQKHIINCPLNYNHKHGWDRNESAYLDYSPKSKNWYIGCSACNQLNGGKVFWLKNDSEFLKKLLNYIKRGEEYV